MYALRVNNPFLGSLFFNPCGLMVQLTIYVIVRLNRTCNIADSTFIVHILNVNVLWTRVFILNYVL